MLTPISVLVLVALSACGGGGGGNDGVASLSGDDGGGGTTSTTLSEKEAEKALLDWAACMRGEGLDVPDPKVDGNGRVQIGVVAGAPDDEGDEAGGGTDGATDPPDRKAFETAMEKCGEPPRVGGELTDEDREEMQEQALALAQCMRDEGIEDFPDPDFSDQGPGAGPSTRKGRVDDDDDADPDSDGSSRMIAGPFGEVDLDDPEMSAAFDTCSRKVGLDVPDGAKGGPARATADAKSS